MHVLMIYTMHAMYMYICISFSSSVLYAKKMKNECNLCEERNQKVFQAQYDNNSAGILGDIVD